MKIMMDNDLSDVELLISNGQAHEVLNLVDARIALSPDNPKLWAEKGWIYYHLNKWEQAIAMFSKALVLKSEAASTLYFRAQCHEKMGNLPEALNDYRECAKKTPCADAFISIGLIMKYLGRLDDARIEFSHAVKLDSTSNLALTLLESCDENEAAGSDD